MNRAQRRSPAVHSLPSGTPPMDTPLALASAANWNGAPPPATIRLNPGHTALVVSLPQADGTWRDASINPERDGMALLWGLMLRAAEARPAHGIAKAQAQASSPWPVGAPVRFAPPHPSPWRDAEFWPRGADHAEGTIVCQRASGVAAGPEGYVMVEFPVRGRPRAYALPPRHLRLVGKRYDAKGRETFDLSDIGL